MTSGASTPDSATVQTYDIIFNIVGLQTICTIGFFVNIFILIVISRCQQLQTPCFLLIAGECFCSIVSAAGWFVNGLDEALLLKDAVAENRTRIYCYLTKSLMPSWGIQCSSLISALISLDRLISIVYPIKYRLLGKRYACASLSLCFLYATVSVIGGLVDNKPQGFALFDVIGCKIFFSSFTPGYFNYYGVFNLSFCVPCVLLYGIMLITFEWRRRRIGNSQGSNNAGNNANNIFMKQQLSCMPMIKLMMAVYIVTAVLPEITVAIAASSEICRPYMPRMYYYGGVVKAGSCLAEILALGLKSRLFRHCAKEMFKKKTEAGLVQPLTPKVRDRVRVAFVKIREVGNK